MRGNKLNLVEYAEAPEITVTGLALIEALGGCNRFTFYCDRMNLHTNEMEQVVSCRLIGPSSAMPEAIGTVLTFARQQIGQHALCEICAVKKRFTMH